MSGQTDGSKSCFKVLKAAMFLLALGVIIVGILQYFGRDNDDNTVNFVPVAVYTTAAGDIEETTASPGDASENYIIEETSQAETEDSEPVKQVYLTFDDGPSPNTGLVLDILAEYGIKATFFVVGYEDEESAEYYKRIVEEGHTLAMHSYTHNYGIIYENIDAFRQDVTRLSDLLTDITGVKPVIYRFPGGSSNTVAAMDINECKAYLEQEGIVYFDWNVSSGDGNANKTPVESIVSNVVDGVSERQRSVVLMHDSAAKSNTVEALCTIIEKLQEMNVVFLPITETTKPVQHK